MKAIPSVRRALRASFVMLWLFIFFQGAPLGRAACEPCRVFAPGTQWGTMTINPLTEASGLAASVRNLGVLWTHNDGSRQRIYAFSTNGAHLANLNHDETLSDMEDIAVGPGPAAGTSYLYLGDIGGSDGTNTVRSEVRVLRVPEPLVELSWADNARSVDFENVEAFTLLYPDGSYDAETLMVDPVTGEVVIATKGEGGARIYRANLNNASPVTPVNLIYVRTVLFADASGGAISSDGTQIVLRREDWAMLWTRCENESIDAALSRAGEGIPIVGPPTEPNGEALAFLPDGSGYMTVSEGVTPALYLFQALCPSAPRITRPLADRSGFIGGTITFAASVIGYPTPVLEWRFNGSVIPGETNSSLTLSALNAASAGQYELIASNASGIATSSAVLTLSSRPDLRITEVQSSTAPNPNVPTADWWELTSFESEPVDLFGWRFNDSGGDLADPFVLPAGLVIAPDETIVFVEGLTPAQFRNWWGAANLPASLQIITYGGNGLSLGAGGDGLRLWNDATSDPADRIASVDFGAADSGVSFNYDPVARVFGAKSQLGANGVFAAALSADIGSPGRIMAPAIPVTLQARLVAAKIRIEFDAIAGHVYTLQARDSLASGEWLATGHTIEAAATTRLFFELDPAAAAQFYRVLAE
jgi:hypothetical protein